MGFGAFGVFDSLVVEEADAGTAPYDPIPIVLPYRAQPMSAFFVLFGNPGGCCCCCCCCCCSEEQSFLTSRRVTGFSSNDRCVSFVKPLRPSRSASSAKLFEVRTRVVRFGIEVARLAWMLLTRLRASRRVCNRGESGKFERMVTSLSVRSMASWSCVATRQERRIASSGSGEEGSLLRRPSFRWRGFCALWSSGSISTELGSKCSIRPFQLYAPLRSNSRSLRGLR